MSFLTFIGIILAIIFAIGIVYIAIRLWAHAFYRSKREFIEWARKFTGIE